MNQLSTHIVLATLAAFLAVAEAADSQKTSEIAAPVKDSLAETRAAGTLRSQYRNQRRSAPEAEIPQPQLVDFRKHIEPVLRDACLPCHGPETQQAEFRVDTLDPDLLHGEDVDWWLEVSGVLSKGEMPPPDDAKLSDADRAKVIGWLASELRTASQVRRSEQGATSFRRMTRYEYNYALQDLLGLPYDFAADLPPESTSDDGFQNSSEMLQMSAMQLAYYRELGRSALQKSTVHGKRPQPLYWSVPMETASAKMWRKHEADMEKKRLQLKDDPEKLERELQRFAAKMKRKQGTTHYRNLSTEKSVQASWRYSGARYAWSPTEARSDTPPMSDHVAVIPAGQKLIVELGNKVPDTGTLRIRVRASRTSTDADRMPSLRIDFGWQASNNSSATERVCFQDTPIDAAPGKSEFYEWDVPLSEISVRNPLRRTAMMGATPSPSEYLQLRNVATASADVQIDFVEVIAPVYTEWPPASHKRIFLNTEAQADELRSAHDVISSFMSRAWHGDVTVDEVDQKLELFNRLRPKCVDYQEAIVEVLATVLSSPKFLYLVRSEATTERREESLSDNEFATRLSMFLWSSIPDGELRQIAMNGRLNDPDVLNDQIDRMLIDPRSERFSNHFVRQWLGMQLLDFLEVDAKVYPQFDGELKEAMLKEPVAFFQEILRNDGSVLDFVHADYAMVNERLAMHYGLPNVYGNHFRKVALKPEHRRGGLLAQAGLLAMNSDGKDSHPLKRGIWLLENLLNDPPPPPPPAVPEIDLADPEIARMTLKERIENHRDNPACMSCHSKIDPWGIAFENYDAVGNWRANVGGEPVIATSLLYNRQELNGMDGLKRFLLGNRQDQFVRALVHKMTTYALGRPLTFTDRASLDEVAAELREQDDGLGTLVRLIVKSELFRAK